MGIFNDNQRNPHTINTLGTQGPRGSLGTIIESSHLLFCGVSSAELTVYFLLETS